jgi:sugar lactone lactonase YvrE
VRAFTVQDSSDRVAVVAGLDGPEAVRYDPDQDVYFVANWAGGGSERDADGFISRVSPEGEVERLRFMTGTADAPLHAPRGMFITADTLWAADVDGVHGFDRRSGAHLAFVSFARFEPGFLNDVAAAPDGTLYITDTGRSRVYRLRGRDATLALEDSLLGPPNGVVWDAAGERFVFAPWGGEQVFRGWRPGEAELVPVAHSEGGNFDGIEPWAGGWLVASQRDSTVYLLENGVGRALIRTPGTGADIGIDTRRGRVAVPYVALDRVDIWELPR